MRPGPRAEPQTYLQVLSLEELIRAPLIATVQADFYAAKSFVRYIREYGFTRANGDDLGHLRMVTFRYRTEGGWSEVSVPLLSLVALPLLQITDADFKYELHILGALGHRVDDVTRDSREWMRSLGDSTSPRHQTTVMASFAPAHPQPATAEQQMPALAGNMSIAIAMRRADVPAGIAALLNVAQSSIGGNPQPRLTLAPSVQTLDPRTASVIYTAAVLRADGKPDPGRLVTFAFVSAVPLTIGVVTGMLVSRRPLGAAVLTAANGEAAISVAAAPAAAAAPADASLTATAELDQGNGQFGPESARALLQIVPTASEER